MSKVKIRYDSYYLQEDDDPIPSFKKVSFTKDSLKEDFERYVSSQEFAGAKLYEYDEKEYDLYVKELHESGYDIVVLATGEKLLFYSFDLDYEE
jgi:hypothetical protein|tara:strand:- start:1565 stop:1846 length:282 start_codon:yes stop_codon:yes gene_type:complete